MVIDSGDRDGADDVGQFAPAQRQRVDFAHPAQNRR
jgi:hypothetical protein